MKYVFMLLIATMLLAFTVASLKPADTKEAVSFTIKNFGVAIHGTIGGLKGTIHWNEAEVTKSAFAITLDAATVNTGMESRDNHLKKEDFFDVAGHSTIRFTSTAVTDAGNNTYKVAGNLTMKGISKAITLLFTARPFGDGVLFDSGFSINRRDFNIGGSSMTMGDEVEVTLKVAAIAIP